MKTLRFAAAAALLTLGCGTAMAQSHLRIGLAEDPDILDPTLARTYVGRIVFASICDKLFDINAKLEIVPQLGAVARDLGGRQDRHHQAAPGREIPRRRAVRRGGGEILVRAPHDHAGLVPQAGPRPGRQGGGGRSADRAPRAEGAVLAADRAAHRPRRHDGEPEGRQGSGRQVRPQAGLRRPLQIRRAGAAGPHRGREVRRLLEQGQCPHRPHHLPADRRRHGAARQPEVRRARPARAAARDRHQGGEGGFAAQAERDSGSELHGHHHQCRRRPTRRRTRSARTPRCARRSSSRSIARRSTRWCSTASSCRAINGLGRTTSTIRRAFRFRSATSPRPRR